MGTTTKQDDAFGREFLERIIEWVGENLKPEDVFPDDALVEWAKQNGLIEEE